jgi:sodium/bile acid cotransporter 7
MLTRWAAAGAPLRRWALIAGIAACVRAALLAPGLGREHGILQPRGAVPCAVALSFLVSGLTLPGAQLLAAAGRWRLLAFIQAGSLLAFPLAALAARPLLAWLGWPSELISGFVILACLPTTIASNAMLTRQAGGDEAGALCNAVAGNLLGLVATPALLAAVLGASMDTPLLTVAGDLLLVVLVPLLAGQLGRRLGLAAREPAMRLLRPLPALAILYLCYTAACAAFGALDPARLGSVLLMAVAGAMVLHGAALALCWRLSGARLLAFSRAERIAALYCTCHKTLAIGAPLIALLHQSRAPGLALLPIIVYHPLQLLVGALLADRLRAGAHARDAAGAAP